MEQFQYHMRQYEEGRLQMNDDDDEEYGYGFKSQPTRLRITLKHSLKIKWGASSRFLNGAG